MLMDSCFLEFEIKDDFPDLPGAPECDTREELVHAHTGMTLRRAGLISDYYPMTCLGATIELDADVSPVFPCLNALIPHARLHRDPRHVQFVHNGFHCALYERAVVAAPFRDRVHALRFADFFVDYINRVYAARGRITPDYRCFRRAPVLQIFKLLPGTNCGRCGQSTCLAMAAAVSNGDRDIHACPDFDAPVYEETVLPVYDENGAVASTFSLWKKAPERAGETPLSRREIEVLRLVARGRTNPEISDELCISPHTVKTHVVNIFRKLEVNDRTQAAVLAAQKNLV